MGQFGLPPFRIDVMTSVSGLTFAEARDMLIHAFAGQILEQVKIEPLRQALEAELFDQLARDLAEVDGVKP